MIHKVHASGYNRQSQEPKFYFYEAEKVSDWVSMSNKLLMCFQHKLQQDKISVLMPIHLHSPASQQTALHRCSKCARMGKGIPNVP